MWSLKNIILVIVHLFLVIQFASALDIFEAIKKNDIKLIKSLVNTNPSIIEQKDDKRKFTPLLKATIDGKIEICKILLENGANLYINDNLQATVLHHAAYHGHLDLVNLYIEKGLDVNAEDNNGYTPIIWAISGKHINIIEELVKNGGNINPQIRIGRNVLHLAAANSNPEVILYLLNKGININAKSDYDNSPLFWAIRSKKYNNIRCLIDNGADLNNINKLGHTPLSFAISISDTAIVKLLLQKGMNINEQNNFGDTYLHAATYQGSIDLVKFLLEKGANPHIANNDGNTALDLANIRKYQSIQHLLIAMGAKNEKNNSQITNSSEIINNISHGTENQVKVSIIYDNYIHTDGMESDWGFSCYIEGTEKNILFDTGTKSDIFQQNLKKFGIDQNEVDLVVISHEHGDHTGGLFDFLNINPNVSVIVPYSFSYNFIRKVESYGTKVVTVSDPVEICRNVYLSGEMGGRIKEQSMAINTKNGLVVICGCSHPGIVNIIDKIKETLNKDIYQVIGGFHLMNKSGTEVIEIVEQMKKLRIQKCSATHCTGDRQIKLIEESFGDNYVSMGVGKIIMF